jgi:hypothetical protein
LYEIAQSNVNRILDWIVSRILDWIVNRIVNRILDWIVNRILDWSVNRILDRIANWIVYRNTARIFILCFTIPCFRLARCLVHLFEHMPGTGMSAWFFSHLWEAGVCRKEQ